MIFLFEYSTCTGDVPDSIAVEGLAMFKTLFDGFSKITEVNSFVNQDFRDLFSLPVSDNWSEDFKEHIEGSDYFLLIAPEDENLLFELTRYAEMRAENLGSSSRGVLFASDKWLTYLKLKNKVNMPETSLRPLDKPYIVKPRLSCGGEGITIGNPDSRLPDGFIAQEFVDGKDLSISLLAGDEIRVLSINSQILKNFRYCGAEIPFDCEEVLEEAIKAVESIKGLYGYVGVDVVLAEVPYVIEVNPRLTTPSIAFREVYGMEIAEMIIRNYQGKKIPEFKPRKTVTLKKVRGYSPDSVFYCRGNSIVIANRKELNTNA
ncbi:MAG TPA: ATP-grasp domain-containing protein [Archaeoglobaceae archaeon]|nr:ATP-grasp domain-containing protein [Archaeoglobaceae archaeon]